MPSSQSAADGYSDTSAAGMCKARARGALHRRVSIDGKLVESVDYVVVPGTWFSGGKRFVHLVSSRSDSR